MEQKNKRRREEHGYRTPYVKQYLHITAYVL